MSGVKNKWGRFVAMIILGQSPSLWPKSEWPVRDSFLPIGLAFNAKGHVVKSLQGTQIEQGLTKQEVLRFRWEGKYVAEWDAQKLQFKILSRNENNDNSWARIIEFGNEREILRMTLCEKYQVATRSSVIEAGLEGSFRDFDGCLSYERSFCQSLLDKSSMAGKTDEPLALLTKHLSMSVSSRDVKILKDYYQLFDYSFPYQDQTVAHTGATLVKSWAKAIDMCQYLVEKTKSLQ